MSPGQGLLPPREQRADGERNRRADEATRQAVGDPADSARADDLPGGKDDRERTNAARKRRRWKVEPNEHGRRRDQRQEHGAEQPARGEHDDRVRAQRRQRRHSILAHPGWGEMLYAKDVFPGARLIHLCE